MDLEKAFQEWKDAPVSEWGNPLSAEEIASAEQILDTGRTKTIGVDADNVSRSGVMKEIFIHWGDKSGEYRWVPI